jgi:hypothetical protein
MRANEGRELSGLSAGPPKADSSRGRARTISFSDPEIQNLDAE